MEMMSLKCNHLGGGYFNCMVEGNKVIAFQESTGAWLYVYDKKNSENERGLLISKFKHNKKYLGIVHSENFLLKFSNEPSKSPLYVNGYGYCGFEKPFLMK